MPRDLPDLHARLEGTFADRLAAAGIAVCEDRSAWHMHHKFALVDGHTLLNGSFNWTCSASDYNQENVLVTQEPRLVEAFARVRAALAGLRLKPAHA